MLLYPIHLVRLLFGTTFFDGKQSKDVDNCPASCHYRTKLYTLAFRSREVRQLLSELDLQGGANLLGIFPVFFKELAFVLAPNLNTAACGAFPFSVLLC